MTVEGEGIIKPSAISGFPEWLPQEKRVEERFIGRIRKHFESFGYTPLETAAVERTEVIASKGVEQKEIYSLRRLHAGEEDEENRYSLHFDLTVPFARYVAMNQGQLVFPFKRYQIQKVWRGERPAQGRFREFYQCDIDVVGLESLPVTFDAELIDVVAQVFADLDIGRVTFRINHRKLLDGFYDALGIGAEARARVLLEVDKIDKIGAAGVTAQLQKMGLNAEQITRILDFASQRAALPELAQKSQAMNVATETFSQGCAELLAIAANIQPGAQTQVIWDGSITRGLNYYTGVVFETRLEGSAELGSICSGGRYDDLAARFTRVHMPGVGISIGLTRLLSHLFDKRNLAAAEPLCPTQVFLAVLDEAQRGALLALAAEMRRVGAAVEVSPEAKLKKQLNYANRKKIPHVLIPNASGSFEWKDMRSGEQQQLERVAVLEKCKTLA